MSKVFDRSHSVSHSGMGRAVTKSNDKKRSTVFIKFLCLRFSLVILDGTTGIENKAEPSLEQRKNNGEPKAATNSDLNLASVLHFRDRHASCRDGGQMGN